MSNNDADFFALANDAFPDLIFHKNLSFNKFSKAYSVVLPLALDHLAFLNEEFMALANGENWNIPVVMRKARIDFSDESPGTKANKKAIAQRKVMFEKADVTCTLHTKLYKTSDRIHFHPPVPQINAKKLLIGIFVEHLKT